MNYLQKIKDLLELSKGAGTAEEAATAAATAQRLMERHRISQAALDASEEAEPEQPIGEYELYRGARRLSVWRAQLAGCLARNNGCDVFTRGPHIQIVGQDRNVSVVRYMYAYLANEIDSLAKFHGKGLGKGWGNSFRLGACYEVSKRLREAREVEQRSARDETAGNGAALVRVNNAIAKQDEQDRAIRQWMDRHLRLRSSRQTGASDGSGFRAGRQAGANIPLSGGARLGKGSAGSIRG